MHERDEQSRGFSLIEVIVATVIVTLVITGLAYTFGLGRGFIDRYEVARAALAEAQGRMEQLAVKPAADSSLTRETHPGPRFSYQGVEIGDTRWVVAPFNEVGTPPGLKDVTVEVTWPSGSLIDTVRLNRIFPAY